MLIPQVVGFELNGKLAEGATATDLVLTVTEMLRKRGVVGKFVEFFGDGLDDLPLADRATIGNMSPEFGSTCAVFPIDAETLRYLELSRPAARSRSSSSRRTRRRKGCGAATSVARYSDVLDARHGDRRAEHRGPEAPARPHRAESAPARKITELLKAAGKGTKAPVTAGGADVRRSRTAPS